MGRPTYRGRLAPSPTGDLHLGHARTYLVAWLRARQAGGTLVMRIEDIDKPRSVSGSTEGILRDLEWLGLHWDEGPALGGDFGPYTQSECFDRYEQALTTLQDAGLVYPCTCSRREIASIASAPHGLEELGVTYPGTCREAPSHPGRPAKDQFLFETAPNFRDELVGEIDASRLAGDFVLRRADGTWSYQLAVTADDAAMQITEVVRGDDLLTSTPRQIALYQALGFEIPSFVHVPLVTEQDGSRASKRNHSVTIAAFREAGVSPSQIFGKLAESLGMPGSSGELSAMVELFSLDNIPTGRVTGFLPADVQ